VVVTSEDEVNLGHGLRQPDVVGCPHVGERYHVFASYSVQTHRLVSDARVNSGEQARFVDAPFSDAWVNSEQAVL
jgi:hypothetical protein